MNPRILELALKKQRLQIRSEAERNEIAGHLARIDEALDTADRARERLRESLQWARDKAPLLSVALLVLLVTRPRRALRLAQRGWVAWMLVRRLRGGRASALSPAVASVLLRLISRVRSMLGGRSAA
ncbi:MAG: hypothetical protein J0M28_09720 [Thauera sp.]|nr:hypothetical protein [Thauera sp.]